MNSKKAEIITATIILLIFYVIIAIVFPFTIPLLIIGFIVGMGVIVFLTFNKSPQKFTTGNLEKNEIVSTDNTKQKDLDYPDEFDHFGEEHDTFEGWCEECEEHEDDLE